ncbi:5-formyltetrahydrofolate cyclo-ligase [candidate division KSB1 bacterium]
MNEKVKIRSKCLKIRKNLTDEARTVKNKQITKRLESLNIFKKSQHILFYYSHNKEVDTIKLIDKYIDTKQLYLPVIKGKSRFQAIPIKRPLNLRTGFEGVPEPIDTDPSSVYDNQIELVITPGVAFDKKGNRLGMGKAYYDRYFQYGGKHIKIALAYEEQVLDYVPKDAYDESVDIIVTDQDIYYCNADFKH